MFLYVWGHGPYNLCQFDQVSLPDTVIYGLYLSPGVWGITGKLVSESLGLLVSWSVGQLASQAGTGCLCVWCPVKYWTPKLGWTSVVGNTFMFFHMFLLRHLSVSLYDSIGKRHIWFLQELIPCAFPFTAFNQYPFRIIKYNHDYNSFSSSYEYF